MKYRKLGRTDIEVSAVAMGCWAIAGDATWGDQDEAEAVATIHAALDVGVTFFDTAELYGAGYSEEVLGKALADRRDRAVVATKVSSRNLEEADLRSACEASLRRLRTDVIDLYQIHWPSRETPVADAVATLDALVDEGKIRAYGVSNFGPLDMADLLAATDRCAVNQLPYSLLWRAIEFEIQPKCAERGISILTYSPLAMGLLTGKFASADDVPPGRARGRHYRGDRPGSRHGEPGCEQETFEAIAAVRVIAERLDQPMANVALAWLLAQPGVASVLAGARRPDQVQANSAAADLELDAATLAELSAATDRVKQILGANVDAWQSQANSRYR